MAGARPTAFTWPFVFLGGFLSSTLKAALYYAEKKGYSAVPFGNDKHPLVKWQDWQVKRADRQQIEAWWKQYPDANVGIVTGKISNLAVIDIDDPSGEEELNKLLPETAIIPTATTPRGGKHLYFSYPTDIDLRNAVKFIPGVDLRAEGGVVKAAPSINGKGGYYQWIAGLGIHEVATIDIPTNVLNIILSFKSPNTGRGREEQSTCQTVSLFSKGRRDDDLFHIAYQLSKSRTNKNIIIQVLELIGKSCDPPWGSFSDDGPLEDKITSALNRIDRKDRNLTAEIKDWVLSSSGEFVSSDVQQCLVLSSRQDRQLLSWALRKFCEEDLIERCGTRNGCFRRLEKGIETLNWYDADEKEVEFVLPLDVQKDIIISPGGMMLIAGPTGFAKTTFGLSTCYLNLLNGMKMPIHYYQAELAPGALKRKLRCFDKISLENWRDKIKWRRRIDNIGDIINPDVFSIIDYLKPAEMEKSYKVADIIDKIHAKMLTGQGLCMILMQKSKNVDHALGGERTADRMSFSANLDWGKFTVFKTTFPRNFNFNPTGLTKCFSLIEKNTGFMLTEDWHEEKKENKKWGK